MNIIITMAGMGLRFKNAGYTMPKYMIEAKGKTLFEWSMDSLLGYKRYAGKYVFVVRKDDQAEEFIRKKCLQYGIANIEIVAIDYHTDGQATTAMLSLPYCDLKEAILVYNIDTYVEPYELKYADLAGDGHIPCFQAEGTHWSFVRTDEDGKVVEVREKVRISDYCSLGAYYFSSGELYAQLYNEYYADNSKLENNEKYIAPLYNLLLEKGREVTISLIDASKVHVLGTPEELERFKRGE